MNKKAFCLLIGLAGLFVAAGCAAAPIEVQQDVLIPNPASVFCEQNGGRLELRTEETGGVSGVCMFADGSECEEWAFFRGECSAGNVPGGSELSGVTEDGWLIYRNPTLGYRLDYPPDTTIVQNDEPLQSFSIVGPASTWPNFTLSHPTDREDWRPPPGTDLEAWLIDHNLMSSTEQGPSPEMRLPDTYIGGVRAIHLRFERSPQSYAYDRYYFAHENQLYMLVIGHVEDWEDWGAYERFLAGITFTD